MLLRLRQVLTLVGNQAKNTFELHDNLVPSVKNQIIKPLCVAFLCKVSDLKAYICVKMLTLLPVASMNHDVGE